MSPTDEERLQRLYDYTKFHIGIYLLAATAMVTIMASNGAGQLLAGLNSPPHVLKCAIVTMFVAGVAGGIVASSCASAASFGQVWDQPIGPWFCPNAMSGRKWAALEHSAFWLSLILIAVAAWS